MAVREKTVYVTDDGKQFDTKQAADHYESDRLYAEYRKAEEELTKVFNENTIANIWDHRRLVQEYVESREKWERF